MKYVVTKQHYDIVPGTVLYKINIGIDCYTIDKEKAEEPYIRIVPSEKVKIVEEYSPFDTVNS